MHGWIKRLLVVSLVALLLATPDQSGAETLPVDLLSKARWHYSIDDGKTFSADVPLVQPNTPTYVQVKAAFEAPDLSDIVCTELTHGLTPWLSMKLALNGREIKPPIEGVFHKTIPAINTGLLKKGANVLTATIPVRHAGPAPRPFFAIKMSLAAMKAEHLTIKTTPILGAFTDDTFTVTCRTNIPATVRLQVRPLTADGQAAGGLNTVLLSKLGLIHRFQVPRTKDATSYRYRVTAFRGKTKKQSESYTTSPWHSSADTFRFVAVGDAQNHREPWQAVSTAIIRTSPALVLFVGDLVDSGRCDWQWDEELIAPAEQLFATIPVYPVGGNHDQNSPLIPRLFQLPARVKARGPHWAQTIGHVLLIGIIGHDDWSAGSGNAQWLEKVLARSKAKFIFLGSHYPGWTSNQSGKLEHIRLRWGRMIHQAQTVILPLLAKYNATAMISGHYHCYERSEPPGGVTQIITGGGGGSLTTQSPRAKMNNPYSKVFASTFHYCRFDVSGDTCTLTALTPDGKILDRRTWKARPIN